MLVVLVVKWVKKPSKHIYILIALSTTRFNKEFKQVLPYQPTSGKSLGQHNPLYLFLTACCKQEQKPCKNKHGGNFIAQVVVGILCGCVVLVVLVVKWVKKPSKHIYILTALSTTRFNKEFKQVLPYQPTSGKTWPTSSTVRVSVSMLENRTGSMQEQTWGKFHCTSLVGILCGCVVSVVLVVLVVKWVVKPSKHIYILSALSTNRFNKEFKQVLPNQPTSGKSLGQHNPLYLFLTACCKQAQNPCKNKHRGNFIAQVVVGILYGCVVLVVLVVKWVVKWVVKPSKHINILTALFTNRIHKQFKQVLPYQPTSGKSLGQHNPLYLFLSACCKPEQKPCKNKHGENCIAQVVVGILRGCVVLVVLVVKWVKKPSKHIYILTALSTNRFNKEFKQVLPYQATSGKTWPTSSTVRVSVSMLENRTGSMQEQTWGKVHCTSLVGILCGCVVLVVLVVLVVKWVVKPSKHIHILIALFITRIHKEFKQALPYQLTSEKP